MRSWLTRLLAPVRRLVNRVKEAIRSLLLRTFVSAFRGKDGFVFWWLIVTACLVALIAALLALVLSPVTALIALIVVGVRSLGRRGRDRRSSASGPASGADGLRDLAAAAT